MIKRGAAGQADGMALVPRIRPRQRQELIELIERATRCRVTLVCGPGGTGKTLACALWAAGQMSSRVVWLTLSADEDQALFWARVYHGLLRVSAATADALHALADVSAGEFPLRLAEAARSFSKPVVIVVDNAHAATSGTLLDGLDLLVRNAPRSLRIIFAGRRTPDLPQLARLRASGDIAVVGPADLASGELIDRMAQ
jgi:LuxR family transcriptional regulator, maltose regulon positive regulatory protein